MTNRRDFLIGATGLTSFHLNANAAEFLSSKRRIYLEDTEAVIKLLGVPLRTGSLYPGTENDAKGYRDAQIVEVLRAAGMQVVDDGDLLIPQYLPHHATPPIRNWPGPRIVWELVQQRVQGYLADRRTLPVLLGCDCSVVVGTALALAKLGETHIIYIDGDFDDAPPEPTVMRSAASIAVWLLTNPSPFCSPVLTPDRVTVVGWTRGPHLGHSRVGSISLLELREKGIRKPLLDLLERIPSNASILVHWDVDVIRQSALSAIYFPHLDGLELKEAGELLDIVIADPRVRIVEVSEYCALGDTQTASASKVVKLLASGLKRRQRLTS